jgi:hypothetical protein
MIEDRAVDPLVDVARQPKHIIWTDGGPLFVTGEHRAQIIEWLRGHAKSFENPQKKGRAPKRPADCRLVRMRSYCTVCVTMFDEADAKLELLGTYVALN